jgi:hypothetical protein
VFDGRERETYFNLRKLPFPAESFPGAGSGSVGGTGDSRLPRAVPYHRCRRPRIRGPRQHLGSGGASARTSVRRRAQDIAASRTVVVASTVWAGDHRELPELVRASARRSRPNSSGYPPTGTCPGANHRRTPSGVDRYLEATMTAIRPPAGLPDVICSKFAGHYHGTFRRAPLAEAGSGLATLALPGSAASLPQPPRRPIVSLQRPRSWCARSSPCRGRRSPR